MKCVICRGESIEKKLVDEELKVNNNNIVLIPVEVLVYRGYGERYYDRRTMQYLEEVEKEIKENRRKLQITGQVLRLVGIWEVIKPWEK